MIDKAELIDALKGMFPVEPGALEEVIEGKWSTWDRDGNGSIGTSEHGRAWSAHECSIVYYGIV